MSQHPLREKLSTTFFSLNSSLLGSLYDSNCTTTTVVVLIYTASAHQLVDKMKNENKKMKTILLSFSLR